MTGNQDTADKEFMTTLAKGLAVIELFGKSRSALTIAQAASGAGVSRATARRILLTHMKADMLARAAEINVPHVIAAEDGMIIDI